MGKITLGKFIKALRKAKDMTQKDLALQIYGAKECADNMAGKIMFLSAIERDKASVPVKLIKKTAEALDIEPAQIIEYKVDAFREKLTKRSK